MEIKSKILDYAFELTKKAYNYKTDEEAKAKLQEKYPDESWEVIEAAYLKARKLEKECFFAAEQCRDKILSEEEAEALLEKELPGFSKKTYGHTLGHGYYMSR